MSKPIINEQQVSEVKELLGFTSCALDNLFVGLHDVTECFTKKDLKTIRKAFELISDLRESFDGSRKQKGDIKYG